MLVYMAKQSILALGTVYGPVAWVVAREPKRLPMNAATVMIMLFMAWMTLTTATSLAWTLHELARGSIDYCVRLVIGLGVPPVTAVQMATINSAETHQIDDDARGFTFRAGAPLDMRMAGSSAGEESAADLLARLGAAKAAALVVTIDDPQAAEHLVTAARREWPGVAVFVRARDHRHSRRVERTAPG